MGEKVAWLSSPFLERGTHTCLAMTMDVLNMDGMDINTPQKEDKNVKKKKSNLNSAKKLCKHPKAGQNTQHKCFKIRAAK